MWSSIGRKSPLTGLHSRFAASFVRVCTSSLTGPIDCLPRTADPCRQGTLHRGRQ